MKLVLKFLPPNTGASFPGSRGVSSLYHEFPDIPVHSNPASVDTHTHTHTHTLQSTPQDSWRLGRRSSPVEEAVVVVATRAKSQKILKMEGKKWLQLLCRPNSGRLPRRPWALARS